MANVKIEMSATITLNADELMGLALLLRHGVGTGSLSDLHLNDLLQKLKAVPSLDRDFRNVASLV